MTVADSLDYEAAVLQALDFDWASVPWTRWSRAYTRLSAALTEDREEVLSTHPSGELGDDDTRAVAALVLGGRTFRVARALLEAYPAPSGRFVELGAGCGPFGLAASLAGHPVSLWDLSGPSLEVARRLFASAGQAAPEISLGSASRLRSGDYAGVAVAYSLNEMLAADSNGAERLDGWIRGWLDRLAPGGRLYILEPGTWAQSRQLQAVRETWRDHVLAPCPQNIHPCPLLARARDWCHFTWTHRPGPVTERLAQLAGRDVRSLRFSWLVLAREPAPGRVESNQRLLELRYPDRHKLSATVCGPDGAVARLTALKRDGAAYEHLAALEPGCLIEVDLALVEPKGDGLRVRSLEAVRRRRPL